MFMLSRTRQVAIHVRTAAVRAAPLHRCYRSTVPRLPVLSGSADWSIGVPLSIVPTSQISRHFSRSLPVPPTQTVRLNYQTPPPPGKTTGRYINQTDQGDVVDEAEAREVDMHDARLLSPPATVDALGFECREWPTAVTDFTNDEEVGSVYYEEIMALVKKASGASRVFVFDHTLRQTGSTNLNAEAGGKAAPVPRVHCDYTANGAPRRLQQLGEAGIYSRIRERELEASEVAELAEGRFAFINVWRSVCDSSPVMQQPLAVCDENSVPDTDRFLYELRFPDRTGENYSLQHNNQHKWYYYPGMAKEECLVFKVYDKKEDGPRFVFHTAFDDPSSPPNAPQRKSIEVRTIAFFDDVEGGDGVASDSVSSGGQGHGHCSSLKRPVFFDMVHSNNAARVRLWLHMKGLSDKIETRMITYPDLHTEAFQKVNPLKKVPALIRDDGVTVFESSVILSFLEDKYGHEGPVFEPATAEGRQLMNLMIRCHDLYIASPNCTAPGFTHSQGAMYLSEEWHGPARGIDAAARAAKVAELWKQLSWLEATIQQQNSPQPSLLADGLSLADFTWFPTCVFMEYLLPRVFGWPQIFRPDASRSDITESPLPCITAWYSGLCAETAFRQTRQDIWQFWEKMDAEGQFKPIQRVVAQQQDYKWRYP